MVLSGQEKKVTKFTNSEKCQPGRLGVPAFLAALWHSGFHKKGRLLVSFIIE